MSRRSRLGKHRALLVEMAGTSPAMTIGKCPVAGGAPQLAETFRFWWERRYMNDESAGGRIFFSSTGRSLVDEDEIVVLSVGVDIGSSTPHLVVLRIGLA